MTPTDSCSIAWSLTLMSSSAKHVFENWPNWRSSDENGETIALCVAGVLIVVGVKGLELLDTLS